MAEPLYELCVNPRCWHFVEPNDAHGDAPGIAEYAHLDDGEQEYDHDAKPAGVGYTLDGWREKLPELFREYPDGKIGPNSACFADAHALDEIARIFGPAASDEPWPSGADVCEWVSQIVRETGRDC